MSKVQPEVKYAVWRRDRYTCRYCKRVLSEGSTDPAMMPTVDHVIPKSKGGSNRASNLVTACRDCNESKGSLDKPMSGEKSGAARLAEMRRWFSA